MSTTDPEALPVDPDLDVCEVCDATYGPSFGDGIYGPWLERHNRRPHDDPPPEGDPVADDDPEVPDVSS